MKKLVYVLALAPLFPFTSRPNLSWEFTRRFAKVCSGLPSVKAQFWKITQSLDTRSKARRRRVRHFRQYVAIGILVTDEGHCL